MLLFGQKYVSNQRGMPVQEKETSATITSVTAETVQLYYYSSGTLTADGGQAAGTVVVAQLARNNIKNALGSMQATKSDTSLSFTSSDLTSEVSLNKEEAEDGDFKSGTDRAEAITQTFSNGQYAVDYSKGLIYGKKASTGTTLTAAAYKVKAGSTSTASSTTNVDQWGGTSTTLGQKAQTASLPVVLPSDQLPTASAMADSVSNPTLSRIGAYLKGYNPSGTWDRLRA